MKTTVSIEGMSCQHCVAHVKEAIEGVEGVKSAKVSLKDKNAIIELGEAVCLDSVREALKTAIAAAGYEAA